MGFYNNYPMTCLITFLCSVLMIFQMLLVDSGKSIVILVGLDKELIKDGDVWRFISYSFAHMSLLHSVLNIPILLKLASTIEKYYGSILFLFSYLFLSISAGITIFLFYEGTYPLAGSSGAGYGLIGILIFLFLRHPNKISSHDKKFTLILLAFSLIFTFSIPDISISGHVGGFISGLVLAFVISLFMKNDEKFL